MTSNSASPQAADSQYFGSLQSGNTGPDASVDGGFSPAPQKRHRLTAVKVRLAYLDKNPAKGCMYVGFAPASAFFRSSLAAP
jgi:hypothetical protein